MAGGSSLLSLLTVFGLLALASGVVVRAAAFRQSLSFAPVTGRAPLVLPRLGRDARADRPAAGRITPASAPFPALRRTVVSSPRALFAACFALYLIIGGLLALHFHSFNGDAQARLANAYYVLFSRDPHLAAIGFVWNPLPSVLLMPLLPLKALWPALTEQAFAANVESALFMAGAVCVLRGILSDLRVSGPARGIVLAAFALNPMILYYGANGMTEALFLLTMLAATRYLMRWLASGSLQGLAVSGACLAVGYLARSEALAAGMAVIALVGGRTFVLTVAARRERLLAAAADAVIVGAPVVTAFAGWAVTSYVITGHPFEQFSSEYGNASQLRVLGAGVTQDLGMSRPIYMAAQLLSYAPLLPVVGLLVAGHARRARDARVLGAMAVLGGVAAFAVFGFVAGQTPGWYRLTIVTVPLMAVLTACLLGDNRPILPRRLRFPALRQPLLVGALAAILLAPALPATALAMANPRIGVQERRQLSWVLHGVRTPAERHERDRFPATREIARYLDDLALPAGSIVLDTFTPCASWIVTASSRPRQFVITNNRDFESVLSDPALAGARYLLVPPKTGYGSLDAINQAYPDLYAKGAGLARLRHEFEQRSCPPFRLYEVTGSPPAGNTRILPRGPA